MPADKVKGRDNGVSVGTIHRVQRTNTDKAEALAVLRRLSIPMIFDTHGYDHHLYRFGDFVCHRMVSRAHDWCFCRLLHWCCCWPGGALALAHFHCAENFEKAADRSIPLTPALIASMAPPGGILGSGGVWVVPTAVPSAKLIHTTVSCRSHRGAHAHPPTLAPGCLSHFCLLRGQLKVARNAVDKADLGMFRVVCAYVVGRMAATTLDTLNACNES